jgi:hypothetical protein
MGYLVAASLWRGWRLFRSGAVDIWPVALGLLGGLAATLAHGLIDNSFFLIDLMALFMLALALLERMEWSRYGALLLSGQICGAYLTDDLVGGE